MPVLVSWYPVDGNGRPIEGVVVSFSYSIETTDFLHSRKSNTILVREQLTDNKGQYRFPWWFTSKVRTFGYRLSRSPSVSFFKAGYGWAYAQNKSKYGALPSAYVPVVIEPNIRMEKSDVEKVDDMKLNWPMPPSRILYGQCLSEVLPLYSKERDKFIKLVNPEREQRGLFQLRDSKNENCK